MANFLTTLTERRQTLSTCESLTAGRLASLIAARPGASEVFVGGFVTYSSELKTQLAGVPSQLIDDHGAVSPECAEAMAVGTREKLGTDWALALTGVAGPALQEDNPVGVVWLGIAGPEGSTSIRVLPEGHTRWALRPGAAEPEEVVDGDRVEICQHSANFAIETLENILAGN
ncbi:CinA family protein [Corynebacterium hindlerae]|uniref:CinA family protein n=1 Tax=Corynebacterium hindlerae TaxID=699041 RepID=UPI003AAE84F9